MAYNPLYKLQDIAALRIILATEGQSIRAPDQEEEHTEDLDETEGNENDYAFAMKR